MKVHLVFVTHNRLAYTKLALVRLLADASEEFFLTIWDNGSTDGTAEYLKNEVNDPRIVDIVLQNENIGAAGAMREVWGTKETEFVGKVDNDCLVTPGWTRRLSEALRDIPRLGAVACWHYRLEDFDEQAARRAGKVQQFGRHTIFRHPWVCGSGFLMKLATYRRYGLWDAGPDAGATGYFLKMAENGEVNGWYYPFILQEHMDDPMSSYSLLQNDESIKKMQSTTYVLRTHHITNMESRLKRRKVVLDNLCSGPWETKYYVGWRRKLRRMGDTVKDILDVSKLFHRTRKQADVR
jgi:glycosyltransferase involved in cell wall biosynthesis